MHQQSNVAPFYGQPPPPSTGSGGGEACFGGSRKSGRRDVTEDAPFLLPTPSPPPPATPFNTQNNSAAPSPLPPQAAPSPPASLSAAVDNNTMNSASSWVTSLSPRGYTAACRAAEQGAAPASISSIGGTAPHMSPPPTSQSHVPFQPVQHEQPHQEMPSQGDSRRRKRRRTEQVSFTSLYKEVFMYLDAVAATQQDFNSDRAENNGGAEEDAQTEEALRSRHGGIAVRSISPPTRNAESSPYSGTTGNSYNINNNSSNGWSQVSPFQRGPLSPSTPVVSTAGSSRNPATPLSAALRMSVDAAVADALRVLRACWEYRGAPHDAFEPVRLLSPITVHLLTSYGHHTITQNGEYVVLRGGAEQLPWVGCLYGILQSYTYYRRQQQQHGQQQGQSSHPLNGHSASGASTPQFDPRSATGGDAASMLSNISRVLLLNCHSFGWLDHVGSDEYERSHRRLYQAREALLSLLEDDRYAALGWHAACPLCSSTMVGGDACTSVLLGDTIVMEGGAPSLGLAAARDTFTAHYQYGRGIACCVPEQRQPGRRGSSRPASHVDPLDGNGLPDAAGHFSGSGGTSGSLCAMHRACVEESRRRGSVRWPAQPSTTAYQVEEELLVRNGSSNNSSNSSSLGATAAPHVTPPSPSSYYQLSSPTLSVSHFPPVCCGTCRAAGVLGQALLLGPTGPLLIHLQFEEREWLEAAAPLLGCANGEYNSSGNSYSSVSHNQSNNSSSGGGWPWMETTAVCPAPLVNTTSLRTDPAGALSAVLYAQMQGHDTTGLSQGHRLPFTSGGGAGLQGRSAGGAEPNRRGSAFNATSSSSGGGGGGHHRSAAGGLPLPPPLRPSMSGGGGGGGSVSLAEFVEWMVRLLHSPPPALVVEWHSSSPASPLHGPDRTSSGGGYPASPASVASSGSPLAAQHPHHQQQQQYSVNPSFNVTFANDASTSPHPECPTGQAACLTHSSSASSVDTHHQQQQQQGYANFHGCTRSSGRNGGSTSSAPPPPPSMPLGMSVRPRLAVVPQLLETYADVMQSRPPPPPPPSSTTAPPTNVVRTTPSLGTHYNLQAALTTASAQVVEQDQVQLEWVLAAQDALQPCEAAAYFDGVERPLVLAKGLEVVAEGERYVNANSVVTSLQFRPRPTGLREHYESTG